MSYSSDEEYGEEYENSTSNIDIVDNYSNEIFDKNKELIIQLIKDQLLYCDVARISNMTSSHD